jgi:hypothetical protein
MFTTPEPTICDAAYYRMRAAQYRKLASDHTNAGSPEIARKLTEFVSDLEATANKLDVKIH